MAASRIFELLITVHAAIAKPIVMRSWRVNKKMQNIIKQLEEAMASIPINDYQTRLRIQNAIDYIKKSHEILIKSVGVIKQWHQADDVWDIYLNHAPEMKDIKLFLKNDDSHAA